MRFDVLITVAEKDFNKLKYCIHSILANLVGVEQIYIVSNVEIPAGKDFWWCRR